MSREFHAIVRNARAAHPLIEEPFHRAPALEVHAGGHDGFHFALQVTGGESAVSVFCDDRLQESDKSRVGIPGAGLAQHFAEHVDDPSALGVNDFLVAVRGF